MNRSVFMLLCYRGHLATKAYQLCLQCLKTNILQIGEVNALGMMCSQAFRQHDLRQNEKVRSAVYTIQELSK